MNFEDIENLDEQKILALYNDVMESSSPDEYLIGDPVYYYYTYCDGGNFIECYNYNYVTTGRCK